jgi:hypothetical protein
MLKMSSLFETLNSSREETISKHYAAAVAELKSSVISEPLRTNFNIYSGCVSEEITKEIAYRLGLSGIKATHLKTGVVTIKHYLSVDVDLPEHLVHNNNE